MQYEQACQNGYSVLKQWDKGRDNVKLVIDYVEKHEWLRCDIEKLQGYIRHQRLVQVAITDNCVYGTDRTGVLHSVGRSTLGIQENYA